MKTLLLLGVLSSLALFGQPPGPGAGIQRTADGVASVEWFQGCDPTGATDSTACFNAASTAMAGKILRVPAGTWKIGQWTLLSNIQIVCDAGAVLERNASITSGQGWVDLPGLSNVVFEGCTLEGGIPTPTGFDRASITTPVTPTFTNNSSIWVHGGSHLIVRGNTIRHTGGHSLILDASSALLSDVTVSDNHFEDDRPFTFGTGGDLTYGAWQGGILLYSAGSTYLSRVAIVDNFIERVAGHGIFWYATNGNSALNRDITESRNHFKVIGLDGILDSGINGLTEENNTFDSIGFVSANDSDLTGTAKWFNACLPGTTVSPCSSGFAPQSIPAVAIDTASVVINAVRSGNKMTLVNGGSLDLDGLGYSVVSHNRAYNPMPSDPDYNGTVASAMGPAIGPNISVAGQNYTYGVNSGNSNNTAYGANYLSITANSFHGLGGGAIRLYGARNASVQGNHIVASGNTNSTTDHNFYTPITIGNIGTGTNQRAQNNTVTKNEIIYSGSSGIYAVTEDSQYGAFSSGDKNVVYDNDLVGALADFSKDINSSSASYGINTTTTSGTTSAGYNLSITQSGSTAVTTVRNQIELNGGNTLSRWYSGNSPTTTTNLMLTASSNGGLYLGNGGTCTPTPTCYTGSLFWGSTALINATQDFFAHSLTVGGNLAIATTRDAYLNSITDVGTASLTLDSARNFRGNSLSIGTASVANTAAGLAIANDRTAYLSQEFIGTNGGTFLKAIDSSNNHTANSYYAGSSITGAQQFVVVATSGTGCSTGVPCVDMGNISNFVQSNAASTVTFAAPVGFGGLINATGLGALSGGGSLLCLDGSGYIRSSLCPAATAPLFLGSPSFTGNQPLIAQSAGAFDDLHDYSSVVGLLGPLATSPEVVFNYFIPFVYDHDVREAGVVGATITSTGDTAEESNGVIGMVVNNTSVSNGVALSGFALANATNARAWGSNLLVTDTNMASAVSGSDYTHNVAAAALIGMEMDLSTGNVGSNVFGSNYGIAYLGTTTHTNNPSYAVSFNVTGGGVLNYFDYDLYSLDAGALVFARIGRGNNGSAGGACTLAGGGCSGAAVSNNSQFIDMLSGAASPCSGAPTTCYTARIWANGSGDIRFIPDHWNQSNSIYFKENGDLWVDGTASQASIVAVAGYMQAAEGFYTTSASGTALHLSSGGASIGSTAYNAVQVAGGEMVGGTLRVSGNTSGSIPNTAGPGVEITYSGQGFVVAYDRTARAYQSMLIDGSSLGLNTQSTGPVTVGGSLTVTGALNVSSFSPTTLSVGSGGFNTTGNATVSGSMLVGGAASLSSTLFVNGVLTTSGIIDNGALSVSGNLTNSGGFFNCAAGCSGYKVGGLFVIDSSRNLLNLGTIAAGNITTTGILNSGGLQASGITGLTFSIYVPGGINCGAGTVFHIDYTGGLFTGCTL